MRHLFGESEEGHERSSPAHALTIGPRVRGNIRSSAAAGRQVSPRRRTASAGVSVANANEAFRISTANGAVAVLPPTTLAGDDDASLPPCTIAEIKAYGDVVLRFVSGEAARPFLPGYDSVHDVGAPDYGLDRLDHIVGNVPKLMEAVNYLRTAIGAPRPLSQHCIAS